MLLPHGTVVALVDGETFDIYRNVGSEAAPQLLLLDPPELDATNHSGGSHRSSPGNHADSQVAEDAHARAAVHWLNSQVLDHRIKDLVVLAPPRTLGEMRRRYHSKLQEVLRMEIGKDLAGFHPRDIMQVLRDTR